MEIGQEIAAQVLERTEILASIERKTHAAKPFKPYITFSRDPGSGGRPVAELVAKKLGFVLLDKLLTEKVAERMHQSTKIIIHVDERKRSSMMDVIQNALNPDYVSDETYFRNMCEVMMTYAAKGGVAIVGRGANFITPRAYGLHVQIVAPYRVRVARAIQYEHIAFHEARERIRKVQADREGFVKQYFGKDIHAPKYYDLTINTIFYSIEQAAEMVICAYEEKFKHGLVNPQLAGAES